MNDRIRGLLEQMAALEGELRSALHEQETRALFEIKGKRVEFERSVREAAGYQVRLEEFRVALAHEQQDNYLNQHEFASTRPGRGHQKKRPKTMVCWA